MTAHSRRAFRPFLNRLDDRCLLSGFAPAQMCQAYGINSFHFVGSQGQWITANGSGQTIAIVDAYHDPNLFHDVQTFDRTYKLPDPQITQYWYGTSTNDGWAKEECLDVEWAHAIAPGAKIIEVEAASQSTADLIQAIDFARNQPGVVAVSMSFGLNNAFEFSTETQYDSHFTTPSGHTGITFLASTGDSGARYGAQYQAVSPNVLAVGGTTLYVDQYGNYLGETGWSGSGGGYSAYEREPSYQYRVQNTGHRTVPDVSMDADPNTGCWIYWTAPSTGRGSLTVVGGTSASTPMWAGLIAIADQGRAVVGKGSLDGPTQTLPAIYSAQMDGDFHDITSGYNGYYAGRGYDLVTGRGTPIAFNVVRDLMQVGTPSSTASRAFSTGAGTATMSSSGTLNLAANSTNSLSALRNSTSATTSALEASSLFAIVPLDLTASTHHNPNQATRAGGHNNWDLAIESLLVDELQLLM